MSFLPENYEPPKTESNYLKLQAGQNRVRILSESPFIDNKPFRALTKDECPSPSKPEDSIRHFWAMVVYDFSDGNIKIWEITQATIQEALTHYSRDPEWGDPTQYGLTITKTGEKLETKYMITPSPHKPLAEKILQLWSQTPIDLTALLRGEDPFSTESQKSKQPVSDTQIAPAAENTLPDGF
jgi:hypothetical protein